MPDEVGVLYVVQVAPDACPERVKFGWTINLRRRLQIHRAIAPTLIVLREYPCLPFFEHLAVRYLTEDCCPVGGEVYDCEDVPILLARTDTLFAGATDAGDACHLFALLRGRLLVQHTPGPAKGTKRQERHAHGGNDGG